MRLSDIHGDRVFDVIADIIEPCCNIAQDRKLSGLFDRSEKRPDGVTSSEWVLGKVKASVPTLVREHKDDLVTIMAAIEGVPADEYRKGLTMPRLVQGIYEIVTDNDLLAFLSSEGETSEG